MPIQNREDAVEVEERVGRIFFASPGQRVAELRVLFVEVLDFKAASGQVSLAGAAGNVSLPEAAERVAEMDGFHVLFITLPASNTDRVRKAEVDTAAKLLADQLGDDLLLIFMNPSANQLHIILPSFARAKPTLRRMVVDRDLPRRTAVQQVSNIYWNCQASRSIRTALDEAFDVEPVTRDFFRDYKAAYDAAVDRLAGAIDRQEAEQFTQTLFNRLLFVHFVSRKGWLRLNGDADYLRALWQDYQSDEKQQNFYTARLSPLFFAGLNNPRSANLMHDNAVMYATIGDVPFLNGGLFEQTELDKRAEKGEFAVPDAIVASLVRNSNDATEIGLFHHYNFTVMESTPLDVEVAVDPEMLGKLFEETVNERHSKGAYYTPRPVVSFMCREAIKGYLASRDIPGLTAAKISTLVDLGDDQAIDQDQARPIADALAGMKAVDPACGSGAFLLGMLQEILALNDSIFRAGHTPESLYRQKLNIITNNIYGVDKDGLAVSTAMLRLWLSLAVDFDGDGAPDPLPNLDLKLVAGDSIAGPDPQQLDFTLQNIVNTDLQKASAAYTTALGEEKRRLREQVDTIKTQLRANMQDAAPAGIVEWRIDFADVMLSGGFDVVIANPPYVRQEDITPKPYKDALATAYAAAVTARSDLYCYFYARALQLLRDGGMHVFVCSNSWLDVGYGAKLQEYLLNNARIHAIYDSAIERQFSTADINTIISVIGRTSAPDDFDTCFVSLRADFETALGDAGQRREIVKNRSALRAGGMHGNKYAGDKWGGKYLRAPDIYHHILDKYGDKLVRLGDVATVRFGTKTGANEFFFLTPETIKKYGIEPEFCRPVMTTPQESRSISVDPGALPKRLFMCHKEKADMKDSGALTYIAWGEAQGFHQRRSVASRRRWYDLGERAAPKLALNRRIDTTSRTFRADAGMFVGDTLYEVINKQGTEIGRLCAAMNSTLFQLMLNTEGRANFGAGVLEMEVYETVNLAIVKPSLLADPEVAIFESTDWDVLSPSAERWQIDGMVFGTLGLAPSERHAVYEGVAELVGNRKRKAGSTPESPPGDSRRGPYHDAVGRNVVARGKAIYQGKLRPQVDEETHHGHYMVIDVFSEDFEIDPHISGGVSRLLERQPGAITYKLRIGYPSVYKMDRPRKRVQ